jgi:DNA-directed RNA polymerase specialized sigma subunit
MGEVDIKAVEKKFEEYKLVRMKKDSLEWSMLNLHRKIGGPQDMPIIKYDTKVSVDGGRPMYSFDETIKGIIDEYIELEDKRKALKDWMDDIHDLINAAPLTDVEYQYIDLRYFRGYKIKDMCDEMGYSERGLNKIKMRVFKKLSPIFESVPTSTD